MIGLDLLSPDWYRANHTVVEFLILSVLFIALVRTALRKQFPDRSGKILAVAMGLGLAIGLTYAMAEWGVTFRDLGLLSAGILALVLGLFVLSLVKGKSPGILGAAGAIFLIFLVLGQKSEPVRRVTETSGLGLLLPILGSFLAIYFTTQLLAQGGHSTGHAGATLAVPGESSTRQSSAMFKTTRAHILQSRWLGDQIKKLRSYVSSGKPSDTGRKAIESAMERINQIETDLAVRLKRMAELAKNLEHQDAEAYSQLGTFLQTVQKAGASPEARRMMIQKDKLKDDGKIFELIHHAARHVKHVKHCLEKADHCLKENNIERSKEWLDLAIKRQEELTTLLTELAKWEERLKTIADSAIIIS
jgi:hypothetical protein